MMYSTAREMFDAVREASRDLVRARLQLAEIEGGGANSSGVHVSVGSVKDPMDRVVACLDAGVRLHSRIKADEELLKTATIVLYGEGNEGGIASVLSPAHADVVWWYYVIGESWPNVAKVLAYSQRACCQMRDTVFDTIDAYGLDAVIEGKGTATA